MRSFEDLKVWHKGIKLCESVYLVTRRFPDSEKYGLISQMQRCSVSVPSNIAEGCERGSLKDFIRFLNISKGSLAELQTQLIIAKNLNFIEENECNNLINEIREIGKMVNGLKNSLNNKINTGNRQLAIDN